AENSVISCQDLKRACWHLKRKNKFDTLILSLSEPTNTVDGVTLTFTLKASWTFSKVCFKGSLVGKDRYEQYYALEGGELFDIAKHQQSLVKIQQELKNQGYLEAEVADVIAYDKETKTVKVTLYVDKTEHFTVGTIAVIVSCKQKTEQEIKKLQQKIIELVQTELADAHCDQQLLQEQTDRIKLYLGRKGFLNPKVDYITVPNKKNRTVRIKYTVMLSEYKRFVFFGNHFFTSHQLLEELLASGSSAFLIPPALLAEDIRALYKKKGFWRSSVEWKEEPDRFLFVIKEQERVQVPAVSFKGVVSCNSTELAKEFFRNFYKLPFFDADALKIALDRLGDDYIQKGFWDFTVLKQDYVLLETPGSYELVITINEGLQRTLKKISFNNFQELASQEPFVEYTSGNAKPFNIYLVQEQRRWLLKYLKKQGFYYASVKPEFITHQDGIELRWHITSVQTPSVFGKTIITGSTKIDPEIFRRELFYKEGDLFDKEKIDQTIKRLKELRIFQSVSLVPHDIATPEPSKTMVLTCIEDDPFEVRTRLGLQQTSKNLLSLNGTTYKLGGSLVWKNPAQKAGLLYFDVDLTRYTRDIALSYEMPWIGKYPINTTVRAYSSCYAQPVIARSRQTLYKESREGVALDFNKKYNGYQTALSTGFECVKLFDVAHDLAHTINFKPALIDKRIACLFIEPSLIINKLDDKVNPGSGLFTRLSAKAVLPLNYYNYYFLKFSFEQSYIRPLYKSLIGASRLRFGHIFNNSFNTLTPTERFYLGGPNSLRGYYYDMVPPLADYALNSHERCWIPVGGKSMIDFTTELRFPLYQKLSGVLFNDVGALAQDKITDLFKNGVAATGFGIRYETPIGPVRFDIGWKWHKTYEHERRYAWFLTFGHSF
ncbi:BamA/TamA family outer membrane protein, partial [Candidatus Dependentiae bacterium]|nr:BamA/TamA family outer membrane protein [Candidatus Dependentiae bacterium]